MAYSRKVHNGAASVLKMYFSEKEINNVNAKMDAGSKKYGPHHHSLDLKHAAFTSHELRELHEELKTRLPTLWTRSYYCESVGHISEATIKRYIEEQKGK